jgi:hypothetical protein
MSFTPEERRKRKNCRAKTWREANPERAKAYRKAWRKANPERTKAYRKALYIKNREEEKEDARRYAAQAYAKNPSKFRLRVKKWAAQNPDKVSGHQTRWRKRYPQKSRDYNRKRYYNDPVYRFGELTKTKIRNALKRASANKAAKTIELVGCSTKDLMSHIKSMWKPGMSWENYGIKGWHIDHIRPCAAFDLTDPEQQKQCFHWTNLQPLWAQENWAKGDRYDPTSAISATAALTSLGNANQTDSSSPSTRIA